MSFVDPYIVPLTLLAAVGCGLMAGLFFAFSNFVMKALVRLPSEQGIAAMQHINVTVINPVFLFIFLGTAVLSVVLGLYSLTHWGAAASPWLVVGSACYLFGTFGVTMAFNVPLNNLLARTNPSASTSADTWSSYVSRWLRWNHVRAVMAVAATASLVYGLTRLADAGV